MAEDQVKKLKPKALKARIKDSLSLMWSDEGLLADLEELAENPSFPGFTYLWGPVLYQRNRVFFRPFILGHFSSYLFIPPVRFKEIRWRGGIGRDLEGWLAEVDQRNDVPLFRLLYSWKHFAGRWSSASKDVLQDFIDRYDSAESPARRRTILEKFQDLVRLDETTALKLYQTDPQTARGFILRHMPFYYYWGEKRRLWPNLMKAARDQGDEELFYKLYRRQVPYKQWHSDVLALCESIESAPELCAALEKRHLEDYRQNLAEAYHDLLLKRGQDVFPYISKHLTQVWRRFLFGEGFDRLIDLAETRDWPDIWAGLVRVAASPSRFNQEVKKLLEKGPEHRAEVAGRLLLLAGVSREFNFPGLGLAQVKQFYDKTALLMYEQFPELLKGPFRAHISSTWGYYPRLLARLLDDEETDLLDFLASRLITQGRFGIDPKLLKVVELLADYYQDLQDKDPARFASRAGSVLGRIPAYSIYDYNGLLRINRLARLFFERSSAFYLSDPGAVSELVEASEIHVMALAYRALGLDLPEARAQAAAHLDILLGTLLRPLHRRTRVPAFGALFNAADSPDLARRVLDKAREASDLPDIRYPKEQLVNLIGRLLHRWPELRTPEEHPVIYRKEGA